MRPTIELDVAGVVVDTDLALGHAERLGARLEQAFALLAERLRELPTSTSEALRDLTLDRLVIELDDPTRALGSDGATLLADELLRQLLARTKM